MATKALLHIDAPIMSLVLNDPDRRNALSASVFDDLERCLDDVEKAIGEGTGHVLRIRGKGSAFCAGFDLDAMATEAALPSFLDRLGGACRRLRRMAAVVERLAPSPVLDPGQRPAPGTRLHRGCSLLESSRRWRTLSRSQTGRH